MSLVLVDSSVWIEYFKPSCRFKKEKLDDLILENRICVNDLILAELIPFLKIKGENRLVNLLGSVENIQLEIDWNDITAIQVNNLKKGINKVGIPDLIILQNAIQNKLALFSLDKHFSLMQKYIRIDLISV